MKSNLVRLSLAVFTLAAGSTQSFAQIGYVNTAFATGDKLFSNPLQNSPNTLSTLFLSSTPNGTTVSLWNSATFSFDTTSTYQVGSGWTLDLPLAPGTGALLSAPSNFTNTFVGGALNHNGLPLGIGDPTPPPLYAGPNGLFLLGDKSPVYSTGNGLFLNILGRAPNIGEQVITLSGTSTYLGGGVWDNTPTLGVGEAVFLNIGPVPVPEPTALGLGLLGACLISLSRRGRF